MGSIDDHQFLNQYNGTKPELYGSATVILTLPPPIKRNLINFYLLSILSVRLYTETSVAFVDTNVSINGNSLSTRVHFKPTDSFSYLLHSSSQTIYPTLKRHLYSRFLSLRRLCSDDSDFPNKSEEMCQLFKKHSYPDSLLLTRVNNVHKLN